MENEKKVLDLTKLYPFCRFLDGNELLKLLTLNRNIFWSWGVSSKALFDKKIMRLRVSGHHHKGYVYILCNGLDLFDVYLTNLQNVVKLEVSGLYNDQLVEWIDENVEKVAAYKS